MQHYFSQKIIKQLHESCTFRHEPMGSTSKLLSLYSLQHEQKQQSIINHQLFQNEQSHLKSTSETQRKFSKFQGFTNRKMKTDQEGQSQNQCLLENIKSEGSTSEMNCFGSSRGRTPQKVKDQCQNDMQVRSIKRQADVGQQVKKFKSMENLDRKYQRHSRFVPKSTFLKIKFRQEEEQQQNLFKNRNKNQPKREVKNYGVAKRTSIKEADKSPNQKIQRNDDENAKDPKCFDFCQNCIKTQMNQQNLRIVIKKIMGICQDIKDEKEKLKKQMEVLLENVLNIQKETLAGMTGLWHQFLNNFPKQKTSVSNQDLDIIQSINLSQSETCQSSAQPNLMPLNEPTTSLPIETVKISTDKKTCTSLAKKISNLQTINQTQFQLYNSEQNFYIPIIAQNQSNFEVLKSIKFGGQETTEKVCCNAPKIQVLTQSYDFDLEEQIDTLFPKQIQSRAHQNTETQRQQNQKEDDEAGGFHSKNDLIGEQFDWNRMMRENSRVGS